MMTDNLYIRFLRYKCIDKYGFSTFSLLHAPIGEYEKAED